MFKLFALSFIFSGLALALPGSTITCSDAQGNLRYDYATRISGIAPSNALGQFDEVLTIGGKEYVLSKFLEPKENFVTGLNTEWTETGIVLENSSTVKNENGSVSVTNTLKRLYVFDKDASKVLFKGHVLCHEVRRNYNILPPSANPGF